MLKSVSDIIKHHKNLRQVNQIISPCNSSSNSEIVNIVLTMNSPFTIYEIKNVVKSLKTKKFLGLDSIISEMIKCANDKMLTQITKLFNAILDSGIYSKNVGTRTYGSNIKKWQSRTRKLQRYNY